MVPMVCNVSMIPKAPIAPFVSMLSVVLVLHKVEGCLSAVSKVPMMSNVLCCLL